MVAAGWPAIAAATEPAVALEVLSAVGGADADALEREVEGRVGHQLERLEVDVAPDSPNRLTVAIDWQDDARTTYAVTAVLVRDGEIVAHDERACELCSTGEVFEEIAVAVAEVVEDLPEAAADPEAQSPADVAPPEARPSEQDPRRLTRLGWGGVGLIAGGAVVGATGAGIWSRGEVVRPSSSDAAVLEQRDYRGVGLGLVATGVALVASGVALVAVDAHRQRRRRFAVLPMPRPRFVGLAAAGRF